jgi:hypothetical protein
MVPTNNPDYPIITANFLSHETATEGRKLKNIKEYREAPYNCAYSGPSRSPILEKVDHAFWAKVIIDSE